MGRFGGRVWARTAGSVHGSNLPLVWRQARVRHRRRTEPDRLPAAGRISRTRESERQASITSKAVHTSCEAISNSSADAISAVNAYVDAYNQSADVRASAGLAIGALKGSADLVSDSLSDPLGPELNGALTRWVDAARAVASAIETGIDPGPFNDATNELNDSRTVALDLCDAAY